MLLKWLGHASFEITTGSTRIITDPFDEKLGYPLLPREAEIVTVSHQHWDHNAVNFVGGQPRVISEPGLYGVGDVLIQGYPTFHDRQKGRERGKNTIFKISAEDLNLLHLGDLGHILSQEQIKEIGPIDILLLPVGGKYTVGSDEAFEIMQLIKPQVVIPMHFMTPHLSFELDPVERFTSKFERVQKLPYLDIKKQDLMTEPKIIVLEYLMG
ncbi:Beta-lactamase-like [Syntrophomonas zehnderi OL-4]|uniref:Beta-lactamase-like n=1 Tax=Syntrophomonas zehnderi OL-4 TaxID=690567 RepID=A0A0E4G9D2_9FIRM|nr:MBL fold metallo-hydrolase [Syntrophomonas zehnderi]CFX02188.1 Beta-lactamase-like [Syntrophomonas zehnderi OL-4]